MIQTPIMISAELNLKKNALFVKHLAKYVIMIHAQGSAYEKFGVRIKAVPESLKS